MGGPAPTGAGRRIIGGFTHRRALGHVAPDGNGARSNHGGEAGADSSLPGANSLDGQHDGLAGCGGEEERQRRGRTGEKGGGKNVLEEGDEKGASLRIQTT